MEEFHNTETGQDMYQQQVPDLQSGNLPDERFDHSNHPTLEEANGEGMYQQDAALDEGYYRTDRPLMREAHGVDEMDFNQQDANGETHHVDGYGTSGQILRQDVQRTFAEFMEKTQMDDSEMDARMAEAEKELADAEDHRIRQHEELMLLRQQLAEVIAKNKKDEEWNDIMEEKLNEIEGEFQQLDHKCCDLSDAQAIYVDERSTLCKYADFMSEIEKMVKEDLDTFKSEGERELADLKLLLEEERAKTKALLDEDSDADDFEDLQKESDEIDKDILDLEIKLDVEIKRDKESRERIACLKEEIAREEEISKDLDKINAEVKRMRQEKKEKQAFLNAELARKDEIVRKATLKKGRLEAARARYHSLLKERDEIKKEYEECNGEKQSALKELEHSIKELVVLQNENATEIGGILKKKSDLEEYVRQKESKLQESRKMNKALKERVSSMEREVSELSQDSLQKQGKVDSLKMTLSRLEDHLRTSNEMFEKLSKDIDQKKNEDAYAGLCQEDELDIESVKIQNLRSLLQESDDIIASREFQINFIQGEWDTLFEKIKSIREAFTSRTSTLHTADSGDVWLEEMRKTIQSEVQVLTEACSKLRSKRDDLRSQIEELKAAQEAAEAEADSVNREKESFESTIQSGQASLVAMQKMIEDIKLKIGERNEVICSLKEEEAKLEKEIESLLNPDDGHSKTVLMKQLEDIDKQVENKRLNVDALKSAYSELEKKILEEQERGEEAAKARREEIAILDKLGDEKEEEIRQTTEKLDKWKAMIDSNKEKRAARVKRSGEVQENLAVIEKEVLELEEKVKQQKTDAKEKEKQRKARLEELQKKIANLKKDAQNKDKAFNREKSDLTEQIKVAQTNMKTIYTEKAKPEANKENMAKTPRNQDRTMSVVRSGSGEFRRNSFGVLTQRDPSPQPSRSLREPFQQSSRSQCETSQQLTRSQRERDRSPSSDSVSSIELSADNIADVRAGRLNIWQLAAKHSQESKIRKKSGSQD